MSKPIIKGGEYNLVLEYPQSYHGIFDNDERYFVTDSDTLISLIKEVTIRGRIPKSVNAVISIKDIRTNEINGDLIVSCPVILNIATRVDNKKYITLQFDIPRGIFQNAPEGNVMNENIVKCTSVQLFVDSPEVERGQLVCMFSQIPTYEE